MDTEQSLYQESLKVYRDNFNVFKTAIQEVKQRVRQESIVTERQQIARRLKSLGLPVE